MISNNNGKVLKQYMSLLTRLP